MPATDRGLTTVHVSTQATWHGGEGQAYLLIRGLRERGHRVVVFARHGGQFAHRTRQEGFEVREFQRRGRGPGSLWRMRRWLKEISPDVVHSHDGHALTAVGLAALGLNLPRRVASRRVDFAIGSPAKYNRLADVVIAISTAVADVCRASGIPDERIRIVHSGVNPSRVLGGNRNRGRQSLKVTDCEKLILVVANLTGHKGHTYLLQALPRVLQHEPDVRLALAGTGELEPALKAEADQLHIREHVDFLGYRDDIPDLLHAADLFVMPSHMEGLCTSILDAMFARVPIVTTGAGGIADAIGTDLPQGPVALTAKPRDPVSLADAIISAFGSPTDFDKLIDRAYDRASEHFSDRQMVTGTLAVYEEILARAGQRAA